MFLGIRAQRKRHQCHRCAGRHPNLIDRFRLAMDVRLTSSLTHTVPLMICACYAATNRAAISSSNGEPAATTTTPLAGGVPDPNSIAESVGAVANTSVAAKNSTAGGEGTDGSSQGSDASATDRSVPDRGTVRWTKVMNDVRTSCVSVSCVVAVETCLHRFGAAPE